ncbi:phosphoribosylglycinamide formyltransferase [Hirschia baltica]|uniref:Phosphoribosylglycinamide formyltransferase n=1 Tax=Hirschia baltica (strain ATCC 49814 / DSM 5838 / IFAM 1418) TaxID=582402 RepID=C6XKN5_HIRBI|nr:phosphoribosylglycinamide formyltransferase [Hirschia baltica]ACT59602.1 phosphoribosylglycinamide formyltransferase [Hirschia baltica ATCC 49814]
MNDVSDLVDEIAIEEAVDPKRIAIFISGTGSNMEALLDACEEDGYPALPVLVLANKASAGGIEKAKARGIATSIVDHKTFGKDREAFERAIQAELEKHNVEFIALAGFMRVLTPWFIEKWEGKMINIHPSLLPSFPGLHTHQRAIDAKCRLAGCSVHFVTAGVDEGPIIGQAAVPIFPDDTAETLASRILITEHKLYPACLEAVLLGEDQTSYVQMNDDPDAPFIISAP